MNRGLFRRLFLGFVFCFVFLCYGLGFCEQIIIIADIHHRPSVQKAIFETLERVSKKYYIDSIFCEGAVGDPDFSFIVDEGYAQRLFDAGLISAAEFWGYKHREVKLNPLEKRELYVANLRAKEQLINSRDDIAFSLAKLGLDSVKVLDSALSLGLTPEDTLFFLSNSMFRSIKELSPAVEFYLLAKSRDEVFYKKIVSYFNSYGIANHHCIVVILGGYHVKQLANRLTAVGLTTKVIYPVSRVKHDFGVYELNQNVVIPNPLLCFSFGKNLRQWALDLISPKKFSLFALPVKVRRQWLSAIAKDLPSLPGDLLDEIFSKGPGFLDGGKIILLDDYLKDHLASSQIAKLWKHLSEVLSDLLGINITDKELKKIVHFHEYLHREFSGKNKALAMIFKDYKKQIDSVISSEDLKRFMLVYGKLPKSLALEEILISYLQWEYFLKSPERFLELWLPQDKLLRVKAILDSYAQQVLFSISAGEDLSLYTRNRFSYALTISDSILQAYKDLPEQMRLDKLCYFLSLAVRFPTVGAGLSHYEIFRKKKQQLNYLPEFIEDDRERFFSVLNETEKVLIKVRGGELALIYTLLAGGELLRINKEVEILFYPMKGLKVSQELVEELYAHLGLSQKELRLYLAEEGRNQANERLLSGNSGRLVIVVGSEDESADVYIRRDKHFLDKLYFRVVDRKVVPFRLRGRSAEPLSLTELREAKKNLFPYKDIIGVGTELFSEIDSILEKISSADKVVFLGDGKTIFNFLLPEKTICLKDLKSISVSQNSRFVLLYLPSKYKFKPWIKGFFVFAKAFGLGNAVRLIKKATFIEIPAEIDYWWKDEELIWPDILWQHWRLAIIAEMYKDYKKREIEMLGIRKPQRDFAFLPLRKDKTHASKSKRFNVKCQQWLIPYHKIAKSAAKSLTAEFTGELLQASVYSIGPYRVFQLKDPVTSYVFDQLRKISVNLKNFYSTYFEINTPEKRSFLLYAVVVPNTARALSETELQDLISNLKKVGLSWPRGVDISDIFLVVDDNLVCIRPDLLFPKVFIKAGTQESFAFLQMFSEKLLSLWSGFISVDFDMVEQIQIEDGFDFAGISWDKFVKMRSTEEMKKVLEAATGAPKNYFINVRNRRQLIAIANSNYPVTVGFRFENGNTYYLKFVFDRNKNKIKVLGYSKDRLYQFRAEQTLKFLPLALPYLEKYFSTSKLASLYLSWRDLKQLKHRSVFYPASGSDAFFPMMLFDPDRLVMLDLLPWGKVLDSDHLTISSLEQYIFESKKRSGFLVGDYLRERGNLGELILLELKYVLKAQDIKVKKTDDGIVEISFLWRHPFSGIRKRRKIYFIGDKNGLGSLKRYSRFFPVDVFFVKASEDSLADIEKDLGLFKILFGIDTVMVSDFKPFFSVKLGEKRVFSKELFWLCNQMWAGLGYGSHSPGYVLCLYPEGFKKVLKAVEILWPDCSLDYGIDEVTAMLWLNLKIGQHKIRLQGGFDDWDKNYTEFLNSISKHLISKKKIISHKTEFYRNELAYHKFEHEILPKILKIKTDKTDKQISIVSIGSSYGEEIATFMYILERYLKKSEYKDFKVKFFLIDISADVLKKAKENLFSVRKKEAIFSYRPDESFWKDRAEFNFICADITKPEWRKVLKELFLPKADIIAYNVVDMWIEDDSQKPDIYNWMLSLTADHPAIMTDAPLPVPESWRRYGPFPYFFFEYLDAMWYFKDEE